MNSRKDDPKLQEVKDVLLRLQRMDIEEDAAAPRDAPALAKRPSPPWTGAAVVAGAIGGLCAFALAAAMYFRADDPPRPSREPATETEQAARAEPGETGDKPAEPPPEPPRGPARVELAQQYMRTGRLLAARELLLEESGKGSEDVALALARSYDPNFLKQVPSADGEPDRAEAERWYREWHAIAKEKGLLTDGVALDRLIRSMR